MPTDRQRRLFLAVFAGFAIWTETACWQSALGSPATNEIRIVELQGEVEVSPVGATTWVLTQTNQILRPFDRLRTGANSRVALRWSDQSVVPFGASTELEILPPHQADAQSGLHLVRGVISFFHRDKPGRIRVITRGAIAGIEGTEFVLAVAMVDGAERTTLSVIDGRVEFGNEQASLLLTNHQQAVAEPGKAPVRTAGFIVNNVLQWCSYYPAVLDPSDLPLSPEELNALRESLAAYRAGDLPSALAQYPAARPPGSDAERVYYGALLLAVGEVDKAETTLAAITAPADSRSRRLAAALRVLVATVKRQTELPILDPQLTTELMANSYYEQSLALPGFSLKAALDLANQAAANSPGFGFARARVAELEFCYGRTAGAMNAVEKSLVFAPRNAQGLALKGFLFAAQNQTQEALWWFNRAIAVDSALGNAWLGRGLCRIRRGDTEGGREDLLVAAALEPQRAGLRSYLGKAYAASGDFPHASKELDLAKSLDPRDPTAWLYSALLNQEHNRINDAIRDLEKSQALNDNRSIYRSRLLLDQDQAVRGANLAGMYRDAGMDDVAVREAARAVNHDYANYSAHHFLADSYHGFVDPNGISLRYETPAQSEYLIANLLAPVSAGLFSPAISQQEYSSLFEHDRFGVVSDTEYLSRGAWTQSGAQYGTFGNFGYDFEAFYRSDPGQRGNNDIYQRQFSLTAKQQLTPQNSVYLNVQQYEAESGDLSQYYDQDMASPTFRMKERQDPNVSLGFHHEWSPGVHTLFLAARLDDTTSFNNAAMPSLFENHNATPTLIAAQNINMNEHYTGRLNVYLGELQQIWEGPSHNTVVGTRIQYGHVHTTVLQDDPSWYVAAFFPDPPEPSSQQDVTPLFKRVSFYGYHQWKVFEPLQLIGGLAYDRITYPENFRSAPISGNETTADRVSPKAGLIWTPLDNTTVRFAYTRSLAGASLDQSCQLEPSQVAGFVQSFRSIIPESIAGANAGAEFETYDLSLEQKFRTGTYLGVSGEMLNSLVNRVDGVFLSYPYSLEYPVPSGLRENLDYQEKSLLVTANQLLGRDWSVGARYRLTQAVLHDDFPDVPSSSPPIPNPIIPRQRTEGLLHQLNLSAIYNHPCGFFARGEAIWEAQSNEGYSGTEPGADFWRFNALGGYRFPRRRAEVTLGLLNLTGQNYRLNPLNLANELPRSRTLTLRLQLSF